MNQINWGQATMCFISVEEYFEQNALFNRKPVVVVVVFKNTGVMCSDLVIQVR